MQTEPATGDDVDYHLDIGFEDGCVVVRVDGEEGPVLRQHIAEVKRAASRCGLLVAVTGDSGSRGASA